MTRIFFIGITNGGCLIQHASVLLPEDYTMNQVVTAIKAAGYKRFMLQSMKRSVAVD